jgi:cell division FtsZ-interacting protein ZapD
VYWLEVAGRNAWKARYLKEVDRQEMTIRFWQETYNERGKLVEIHEKFPVDLGHRKV